MSKSPIATVPPCAAAPVSRLLSRSTGSSAGVERLEGSLDRASLALLWAASILASRFASLSVRRFAAFRASFTAFNSSSTRRT
ncbi:hypothetical protein ADK41_33865 [Streptomyces caelestis]|uniref:Uncharacterized protein n=1 Tax=Streptomyces caelestis TaxID=36816 RepID=A0A0M8QLS8_9ACTN|nr:hypothetical protein ADK41_33865 [Streptomyces caelestis]KOV20041.1 hypothetical protein ADK58_34985 [Streptomyces sp. XY152]